MVREKITLSIEEKILIPFKLKAEEECWSISKKVEKFMEDELLKNEK